MFFVFSEMEIELLCAATVKEKSKMSICVLRRKYFFIYPPEKLIVKILDVIFKNKFTYYFFYLQGMGLFPFTIWNSKRQL